jgi:hypothetical protein
MGLSADGMARDGIRARRKELRARAQRHAEVAPDEFQTPQWLERSFVLPITDREIAVPSQSQPRHDDLSEPSMSQLPMFAAAVDPPSAPTFVRPPSREIDFARMIKRSDHCRTAVRAAIASIGFAGLAVVAFLLTMDPLPLELAIACTVLALVAVGVRARLGTAPVPHIER